VNREGKPVKNFLRFFLPNIFWYVIPNAVKYRFPSRLGDESPFDLGVLARRGSAGVLPSCDPTIK
jgi:hypothetical protein